MPAEIWLCLVSGSHDPADIFLWLGVELISLWPGVALFLSTSRGSSSLLVHQRKIQRFQIRMESSFAAARSGTCVFLNVFNMLKIKDSSRDEASLISIKNKPTANGMAPKISGGSVTRGEILARGVLRSVPTLCCMYLSMLPRRERLSILFVKR